MPSISSWPLITVNEKDPLQVETWMLLRKLVSRMPWNQNVGRIMRHFVMDQKTRKYLPLMIPTFISVIRSTNIFSMALESKGFGYSNKRTNYLKLTMGSGDYFMLFLGALVLTAAIFIKVNPDIYRDFVRQFPWSEFSAGYYNWSI